MISNIDADLEKIAHLDFDVDIEKTKVCRGYLSKSLKTGVIHTRKVCDRPAELIATWRCCGDTSALCVECYNMTCSAAARTDIIHSGCLNRISAPIFLPDLEWL
jgi:hypothetical protein